MRIDNKSEYGMAVSCAVGTPLEGNVEDALQFNFLKTKTLLFPEWDGEPGYINGGVVGFPHLKRDDGEPVDSETLARWEELDEYEQKRVHPEIPEGHHTEIEYEQRWGWYAVVPNSFVVDKNKEEK